MQCSCAMKKWNRGKLQLKYFKNEICFKVPGEDAILILQEDAGRSGSCNKLFVIEDYGRIV